MNFADRRSIAVEQSVSGRPATCPTVSQPSEAAMFKAKSSPATARSNATIRTGSIVRPHHALAIALACVCVALPGAEYARAAPALASTSAARCLTGHLRLSFVRGQGATSHRFWDFALRNVGPGKCRLQGYPGVGLLNKSGRLISVNVAPQAGPTPTVVIGVGQRGYFTFSYVVSGPCLPHFFNAYGLQVIPPNRTHRLVYHSGKIDVCSISVGGHPTVSPLRARLDR
jgi:hypothetical protein